MKAAYVIFRKFFHVHQKLTKYLPLYQLLKHSIAYGMQHSYAANGLNN